MTENSKLLKRINEAKPVAADHRDWKKRDHEVSKL